jgi:hypothetical protein
MHPNPYKIAYYIITDIQHLPPVIRLFPFLQGIVITENREIYDFINLKYKSLNIPCYYTRSRKESHSILTKNKIRVVIYPGYQITFRGKAVQIFHGGLSDKTYVESVKVLLYDLVLFPGEKTKDKVNKAGYLKAIPKWSIVGYPKFDPLINKSLEITPIFRNNRKTILYAPTWVSQNESFIFIKFSRYGESSLELWSEDIIRALHKDYNIIIKYHSRIYRKPHDIYERIDKLIEDLGVQDTVVTRIDDNILPYMREADLMISDMSTACYEWFHFDKPIVFANPSPGHYERSNDISSNTYAWQTGDVINHPEDIGKFVKANLDADSYNKIRNEVFQYTVYKPDGNATERQVKAIADFVNAYSSTPYYWLLFTSWIWRRYRRSVAKLLNRYYKVFRHDKIGR